MARKKKAKQVELDEVIREKVAAFDAEPLAEESKQISPPKPHRFVATKNFRHGGVLYAKGEEVPESCHAFVAQGFVKESSL